MPGYGQNVKSFVDTYEWAGDVNRYAISSGCRAADTAWKNWLDSLAGRRRGRRVGYPRFKKRGRAQDSFTLYHDVKRPTLRPDGYGSTVALAPRFAPTSQTCSRCGWRDPNLTLSQRMLDCPTCGPVDRDVNAARNILAWAQRQAPPVAPEKEETRNARGGVGSAVPRGAPDAASAKREGPPGSPRPSNRPPVPTHAESTDSAA